MSKSEPIAAALDSCADALRAQAPARRAERPLGVSKRWLYSHGTHLPSARHLSRRALRLSEPVLRRWMEVFPTREPAEGEAQAGHEESWMRLSASVLEGAAKASVVPLAAAVRPAAEPDVGRTRERCQECQRTLKRRQVVPRAWGRAQPPQGRSAGSVSGSHRHAGEPASERNHAIAVDRHLRHVLRGLPRGPQPLQVVVRDPPARPQAPQVWTDPVLQGERDELLKRRDADGQHAPRDHLARQHRRVSREDPRRRANRERKVRAVRA